MGAHGGSGGNIIVKTDGEASIVALREALAKYHGGVVTPETPPPTQVNRKPTARPRTTGGEFVA